MPEDRRRRTSITAVRILLLLAFLAAATFLTAASAGGAGRDEPVINLGADVEPSQCSPCHQRLGEATYPGLIFSHGNHLMVSCTSCHYRMAHVNGTTYRPPMQSCFNCHGIEHGADGELASSKCSDCHTPSFDLRPSTHTKQWKGRPHAKASSKTANECLMCHTNPKRDCDACHEERGLDVKLDVRRYVPVIPATSRPASTTIYPERGTTIAQCVNCHPDLDDSSPAETGVIFAHDPHIRRNFDCVACHPKFGHENEKINRPDMKSCYRCHGLTHAENGLVAAEDCAKCHPAGFTLKPSDHTKPFVTGTHAKRANSDGEYCAMCHKPDFCVECHMGRRPRADGSPGKPVIPVNHTKADWKADHGGLFLEQKGACGSCHDEPSCMPCHQTPMPHPVNWLSNHNVKDENKDCNVCHTDRERCQDCHHGSVKRAELVAANCVPCHEIMRTKPATSIKNKGFSEHAVHFDVAKTKGKPYKCYECHVGFGAQAGVTLADAGHDLRLCYGCHGALNPFNEKIAPYAGAELCRRCHTDLNI